MTTITPFLWFDSEAEQAAQFYTSIFKDSAIGATARYSDAGAKASGMPIGSVMTVSFVLNGQPFTALNGGPVFKFTEAISFVVSCKTQEEIDYFWQRLSAGGHAGQCGWLRDMFGVSWQVVPEQLGVYMSDPEPERSARVMSALIAMTKLNMAQLQEAYDG